MQCQNCGGVSTTKKYPGKVGTLCIPCWNRRIEDFQEQATSDFDAKWDGRIQRWGFLLGTVVFYTLCLIIIMGFGFGMWWWLW